MTGFGGAPIVAAVVVASTLALGPGPVGFEADADPGTWTGPETVLDSETQRRVTVPPRPARTQTTAEVRAECSVSDTTPDPGQEVTIDASASVGGDLYRYDTDGDGEFENASNRAVRRVSYDVGSYQPVVRVVNETGESDTVECPAVTVRDSETPIGEGPTARFAYSPQPAIAGESTRLDASASTAPNGTIVRYRWDFDGDGSVDETVGGPVTTHVYPYNATFPGLANTVLTVVTGADRTDTTGRDVVIERSPVQAECTVEPRTVAPGEAVTLSAAGSQNADRYQFAPSRAAAYGGLTSQTTTTVTYGEPGTYTPRVRAWIQVEERSDEIECPEVTVRSENEPPEAVAGLSPPGPTVGSTVTLDGSRSSDPDGRVVEYRWDTDGDGTAEITTTRPTARTTFSTPGNVRVTLTVVDDDNATDTTTAGVDVVPGTETDDPTTTCRVDPGQITPGEAVVVDASGSEAVSSVEFDTDGDGEDEVTDETDYRETVVYDEIGEYAVRVRVYRDGREPTTADCGTVVVRGENSPPRADVDHVPLSAAPGGQITFDASNSWDADGRIVEYRWDFGADGNVETTTNGPTVTSTYRSAGNYTVRIIVVDDDNATDNDEDRVAIIEDDPEPTIWPWLLLFVFGGGGGGYLLCRRRGRIPDLGSESSDGGITAYATGTFETPAESNATSVTGLGFEPDIVLFTAATALDHTDGWSYGKALRNPDGTVTQNAVSIVDDARSADATVCSVRSGRVFDLAAPHHDRAESLAGSVERTTSDGFELGFEDSPATPSDRTDDRHRVMFQAFALADDTDAAVGHVRTPTGPESAAPEGMSRSRPGRSEIDPGGRTDGETSDGSIVTQSVDVGFDPDHVVLTATNAARVDEDGGTDGVVGVSHGEAVRSEETIRQRAVNSSLDPGAVHRNSYAATESEAVHLLYGDGDPDRRTTARVTGFDDGIELTYDELANGPGLMTYLAVGGGDVPAIGHVGVPAPDDAGRIPVDVGFEPAMVELTACNVDVVGGERTVDASPFSFGWSHGTVTPGPAGIEHYMLHGAFDAVEPFGGPSPGNAGATGAGHGTDGGRPDGGPESASPGGSRGSGSAGSSPAGAAVFTIDDDGRILGRDDVRVDQITETGFELSVTDVSTDRRSRSAGRRPVVFYKAWPAPEGSS
jgi:PKD repeat protein